MPSHPEYIMVVARISFDSKKTKYMSHYGDKHEMFDGWADRDFESECSLKVYKKN